MKRLHWIDLREKCPIDIEEITREARSLEIDLRFIKYIKVDRNVIGLSPQELNGLDRILKARVSINKIISMFISLIRTEELLATPTDKKIFELICERLGRIIRFIDTRIKDTKLELAASPIASKLILLAGDVRDVLISGIYTPLFSATNKEPSDPKRFLRALLFEFDAYTSVFGAVTRENVPKNMDITFPTTKPNTVNQFVQEENKYNENPNMTIEDDSPLSILDDLRQHTNIPTFKEKR